MRSTHTKDMQQGSERWSTAKFGAFGFSSTSPELQSSGKLKAGTKANLEGYLESENANSPQLHEQTSHVAKASTELQCLGILTYRRDIVKMPES